MQEVSPDLQLSPILVLTGPRRDFPVKQPGVMSLLKVYDSHADFVTGTRHRRPSALTVYLPIWHADVLPFIRCRTSRTPEGDRMRHVFPALWVPDCLYVVLRARGTPTKPVFVA